MTSGVLTLLLLARAAILLTAQSEVARVSGTIQPADAVCTDPPAIAQLIKAAAGETSGLGEILTRVNVNSRDCHGRTALYVAVTEQKRDAVELLLAKGEDPNLRVTGGDTVLVTAVRADDADIVYKLVTHGADVNTRTDDGYVLLEAVKESCPDVVASLLARGANARLVDENGRTAVMLAIKRGYVEIVGFLLSAGADLNAVSYDGDHAIVLALQERRIDLVNLLWIGEQTPMPGVKQELC
jgi:hypothetical protein